MSNIFENPTFLAQVHVWSCLLFSTIKKGYGIIALPGIFPSSLSAIFFPLGGMAASMQGVPLALSVCS